ncbi:MAG: HlyC/CorC family transporter [Deltaproteobacteria bacterium]|nr:HlyC/CorC family transporter [Deltaproteobacteria bacterium]
MDESHPLYYLLLIGVLLLLSAFFSGSETALMSFRKMRLKHLVREGNKKAALVEQLLKDTDRLLGTLLVGNNLVNVAASVLTGALTAQVLEPRFGKETALFSATVIMTFLLLIFAEITPKTYAAHHSERVSFGAARPIRFLEWLLAPLVSLVTRISKFLLHAIFRSQPMKVRISPEEIRSIIAYGAEEGVLAKEKGEMLHGIFDISKTIVREVMVPRPDIIAIDIEESIGEILQKVVQYGHSRYPVYQDQIDKIIGFLFVKDLLPFWSKPEALQLHTILRPPSFVPETKRVDQLIEEFRKEKRQISIVADEYGSVAGLVSMEDLLEEITGEIQDEYDLEQSKFERLSNGSWLLDGSLPLDEVYEITNIKLPEGEYETIAGFLLDIFGKIPREGEEISYREYLISAYKMSRHRIVKIKFKPID